MSSWKSGCDGVRLIALVMLFLAFGISKSVAQTQCEFSVCNDRGNCTQNTAGDVTCECQGVGGTQFTGERCEFHPCGNTTGACVNLGLCVNGECDCPPGTNGSTCQFSNCDSGTCRNGATCTPQQDGVTCTCAPGFSGDTCDVDNRVTATGESSEDSQSNSQSDSTDGVQSSSESAE